MAKGKSWTLTDARRKTIISMLEHQHTPTSIAHYYKVTRATIDTKLREAGIDAMSVRNSSKVNMRARLLEDIVTIKDPYKRVDAMSKYLSQYPIVEDIESSNGDDIAIDIRESILAELHIVGSFDV